MTEKNDLEYSEFLTHKGMDIEVLGEVFSEPVKRTDSMSFHTRVTFVNVETGQKIHRDDGSLMAYYFERENDADSLRELVRGIKNTEKYLP